MICTNCGTENEAGRKFCGEWAARLAAVCPACGASNSPTAKFCGGVEERGRDFREESREPIAGGSGLGTFQFDVPAAGAYEVAFELKRTWESEALERRVVRLIVTSWLPTAVRTLALVGPGPVESAATGRRTPPG